MSTIPWRPMLPLGPLGIRSAKSWLGPPERPGLLALRHALDFPRPGLVGEDRSKPRSILLVRHLHSELFGAGDPEPAAGWIATCSPTAFTLHAPDSWHEPLEAKIGKVSRFEVETFSVTKPVGSGSSVVVHQLTSRDRRAFRGVTPSWACRAWLRYDRLITHGAAFGVRNKDDDGFLSVAWIFDQAGPFDAIGVATKPRFQRLGLGRASASELIDHIINIRGKVPLWSTSPVNDSSRELALALGFSRVAVEPLFLWSADH